MSKFVAVFFIDSKTGEVCYLLKDKPNMPFLHEKLTGFGGHIEPKDKTPLDALVREIKEELDLEIPKEQYFRQGKFYDKYDNLVYVFKCKLNFRIPEEYIEDEGQVVYKPKGYFRSNPEKFVLGNPEFLEHLLYSNEEFIVDYRKESL